MHDVELAKRFADRIVGMRGGLVVFDGKAADLTDAILNDIYGGDSWLT
jgi:phosphonate transport system ATP-binding protein